ncbi:MAG: ATP-binding cassette domain-containing protein [Synergistaceae bacterium]|nr:ATP-binding cassette domain-containing protein [Synergistaceae bacterium]
MKLLELRNIEKDVLGIRALDGVSLEIESGEIHGLVGANGAGKTALVQILAGASKPDGGVILLEGREIHIGSVRASQKLGVGVMFQDSFLIADASAAQNIMLGFEPQGRFGMIDESRIEEAAAAILRELGISGISPGTPAGELSRLETRLVEFARASFLGRLLVILDEPLRGLSEQDAETLLEAVRHLKSRKTAVILVTNDPDGINSLCGRITVFRRGRNAGTVLSGDAGEALKLMGLEEGYTRAERTPQTREACFDLGRAGVLRRGEIVGITCRDGKEKTGIIKEIFGIDPRDEADTRIFGVSIRMPSRGMTSRRIGLSRDERRIRSVALSLSVRRRAAYAQVEHSSPDTEGASLPMFGLGPRRAAPAVETEAVICDPRGGWPDRTFADIDAFIFDEPSISADPESRARIYGFMESLAGSGKCVVMFSEKRSELDSVCDRVTEL